MSDIIIMGAPRQKRYYDMKPIILQGLQQYRFVAHCPNCYKVLAMQSARDKFRSSYYCSGCDKNVDIKDENIGIV